MITLPIFTAIDIAFLIGAFSFVNGWLMAEARAAKAAAKAAAKKVWYSPAAKAALKQNMVIAMPREACLVNTDGAYPYLGHVAN